VKILPVGGHQENIVEVHAIAKNSQSRFQEEEDEER
jgi:hypothetical protein